MRPTVLPATEAFLFFLFKAIRLNFLTTITEVNFELLCLEPSELIWRGLLSARLRLKS